MFIVSIENDSHDILESEVTQSSDDKNLYSSEQNILSLKFSKHFDI